MSARTSRYGSKLAKKVSAASEPEDEDEEVDETFVALQKLLKSLNKARTSSQPPPVAANMPVPTSTAAPATGASDRERDRLSSEEILECRRQEREQFRRCVLSRNSGTGSSRRRRGPAFYCSEDDEEEDAPVQSVESTISNRFMNGSFSRALNVHVISRDRWSNEERIPEQLPVVMLPKSGKVSSPAENPKLKVTMTGEHAGLREQLLANIAEEEEKHKAGDEFDPSQVHYLKPPRSTWTIQKHDFDNVKC